MLNEKHRNAIEYIRENLNFCPCCGGIYDVGVCLEDNTICIVCSCGYTAYKVTTWDKEVYKAIALAFNMKTFDKECSVTALNRLGYNKLPYFSIRSDTGHIIGNCYTLLEAICGNYVMKDCEEYKDIPLSIGKFEDGKIRIVTLEEVQKQLDLQKEVNR